MPNKFITEQVDIYELPNTKLEAEVSNGIQITIGDLHGNAIKLLFMLIKHGIATNISEDYKRLVEIYKTPAADLKKEYLDEFVSILASMEFHSKSEVRLLGDELADRGSNDYFTLKVLEKLIQSGVPVEIIISNHSVEFIEAYEKQDEFMPQSLFFGLAGSMQRLQTLIDDGLVSREEILKIVNNTYKPVLKAISYSLDNNKQEITIYSHAGIGLNTIKFLAAKLNVEYKDTIVTELAQTIDQINLKFQEHVQNDTVHGLYTHENMTDLAGGRILVDADVPFEFIMWNRDYDYIDRPAEHSGYKLCFAHGHDSHDPMAKNGHVYNLDNYLGKSENHNEGEYTVLQTDIGMATKKEETLVQESPQPKDSKNSQPLTTKQGAHAEAIRNQGADRRALTDEAENAPCPKVTVEATAPSPESTSEPRTQDESEPNFSRMMPNLGDRTVETLREHSDSPVKQPLPENQVHTIKELLCNYLKYLSSYPTVISTEQNIYFKEKDDCSVTINQSVVAERLDEVKRSKLNKTCELLIKLKKNDGAFQTDVNSHDTKELLSAHRDNIAIRMLKAIRCILTLGCVPKWNFFSSRGKQVIEGISDVSRFTPTR